MSPTEQLNQQTTERENIANAEVLAYIEDDWRDTNELVHKLQQLEGMSGAPESMRQKGIDNATAEAASLLEVIQAGGDDAEAAQVRLLELEAEPAGIRQGWAKATVENNASKNGINYLRKPIDDLSPAELQTKIFSEHLVGLVAAKEGDERKFASMDFPSYAGAMASGLTEQDFYTAAQNLYPMLGEEKDTTSTVTQPMIAEGGATYGSQTETWTSTKYGFTIYERTSQHNDAEKPSYQVHVMPTIEA